MANPSRDDSLPENPIQLVAWRVAGVIVDSDESYLYGVLVSYVSLGQGDTF
jgi:hypothetical protein